MNCIQETPSTTIQVLCRPAVIKQMTLVPETSGMCFPQLRAMLHSDGRMDVDGDVCGVSAAVYVVLFYAGMDDERGW